MPTDKDARKLRHILKAAGDGQQADQSEVNAAVGRSMQYVIPVMVFVFTINLAAALSLYWFVGGVVAYIQQRAALKDEGEDLVAAADEPPLTKSGSKITISSGSTITEEPSKTTTRKNGAKKAKKKRR